MEIVEMNKSDWGTVIEIYYDGILTGDATFQTNLPTWQEWDNSHLRNCRFVAKENNKILGWTALSPVSSRCVYAGVAEVSIYVDKKQKGKGIGKCLLEHLVENSEHNGIWTLQSSIFPENKASMKIHLSCGFVVVGRRKRIGKLKGEWRDTVLMERRSDVTGID